MVTNSKLLGASAKEAALVDQWVSFADAEIGVNIGLVYYVVKGLIAPYSKSVCIILPQANIQITPFHFSCQIHETIARRLVRSFGTLEKHFAVHTFLVTEYITLADITVAAVLQFALQVTFDASSRAQHPNVLKFFEKVANHPKIKEALGETEYIEKALEYAPPVMTS